MEKVLLEDVNVLLDTILKSTPNPKQLLETLKQKNYGGSMREILEAIEQLPSQSHLTNTNTYINNSPYTTTDMQRTYQMSGDGATSLNGGSYMYQSEVEGNPSGPNPDPQKEQEHYSDDETPTNSLSYWDSQLLSTSHSHTMDQMEKHSSIARIGDQFISASQTFGEMIIAEQHIPQKDKKIQTLDVGGIAGGSKFKVHGLFFKYPVDVKVGNSWLYGGAERDDLLASKASNHDMKGFSYLMKADMDNHFNYPLFSLFDFKGYRLMIMTELPLSKDPPTLIYGSGDGGKTCFCDNEVHQKMEPIAKTLNLKEHCVTPSQCTIHLCGDIEVHKISHSQDDLLYILDTARIFPPTHPSDQTKRGSIFYRMFRPEFVSRYHVPLVSDALSGWLTDTHRDQMNAQVLEATEELQRAVDKFAISVVNAKELPKLVLSSKWRINQMMADENILLVDSIIERLHCEGINFRYFGRLILLILDTFHSDKITQCIDHLLTILLSRALKNYWRKEIRTRGQEKRRVHDICLEECIDHLLTILLSRALKNYWRKEIRTRGQEKRRVHDICLEVTLNVFQIIMSFKGTPLHFNQVLTQIQSIIEGTMPPRDVTRVLEYTQTRLPFISLENTIFLFSKLCGVILSRFTIASINKGKVFTFGLADILRFSPIIKTQPFINYYTGLHFYKKAKSIELSNPQTKFNYYSNAGNKFLSIMHIGYKSTRTYFAKSCLEAAKLDDTYSWDIFQVTQIFKELSQIKKSEISLLKVKLHYFLCLFHHIRVKPKYSLDWKTTETRTAKMEFEEMITSTSFNEFLPIFRSLNETQQGNILEIWAKSEHHRNLFMAFLKKQGEEITLEIENLKKLAVLPENVSVLIQFIVSLQNWNIAHYDKLNFLSTIVNLRELLAVIQNSSQYQSLEESLFCGPQAVAYVLRVLEEQNMRTHNSFILKSCLDELLGVLNETDYLNECLLLSSKNGHLSIVKSLLAKKADVSAQMNFNYTPLFLAVENVHSEVVQLLLDSGACANDSADLCNLVNSPYGAYLQHIYGSSPTLEERWSALHMACYKGHVDVVQSLLHKKADIEPLSSNTKVTPLHLAAIAGHNSIIELLLNHQANVDYADSMLYTPLHLAAQRNQGPTVELLLAKKANIEAVCNHAVKGITLYHHLMSP
eukprot:TRINITY_DN16347_c0_g1_i2.p1 TRINITY_DN16347_c0_g1~~TRINITY_DN16347_c0_g1_i2.p1  ORF type:complete len:1164 (-),score=275.74 TRINITY_DN16347_c0_g1_i2:1186-4650(-)